MRLIDFARAVKFWVPFTVIVMLLWELHRACGAPPPGADPALHPWFESLQDPQTGGSCCGEADCRHNPVATYTGEDGATHYRVQYKGQWLPVDDARILKREDNPTGDYVSCVYDPLDGEAGIKPKVLCLIRAPGT